MRSGEEKGGVVKEKGGAEEEEYRREEHVIFKLDCSSIVYRRCICRRISGEVSNNPSPSKTGPSPFLE